jgi:hypothetical protein
MSTPTGDSSRESQEKAARKVLAADADNPDVFRQTEFGRKRVMRFPRRILLGICAAVAIPFVVVWAWLVKRPQA